MMVNGCIHLPLPNEWAGGAIGATLDKRYGQGSAKLIAKDYFNKNGEKVVMIPITKTCDIYYTLDKNGIVISYKLVGADCNSPVFRWEWIADSK